MGYHRLLLNEAQPAARVLGIAQMSSVQQALFIMRRKINIEDQSQLKIGQSSYERPWQIKANIIFS